MCFDSVYRINVFAVQLISLATVSINSLYICNLKNFRQIVRYHVSDAGIRRTFDFTAFDYIPDCNVICKQHCFLFFYCMWNFTSQDSGKYLPETVLFMSVEKLLFPGLYRWKTPQNQDSGVCIIDRWNCVFYHGDPPFH